MTRTEASACIELALASLRAEARHSARLMVGAEDVRTMAQDLLRLAVLDLEREED